MVFGDEEVMDRAAARLRESGWTVGPVLRVEEGVFGWTCSRPGEDGVVLACARYGLPLEPERVVFTSWADFVEALSSVAHEEGLEKLDDHVAGLVGFVSYRRSFEGRSEVFQVPSSLLREGGVAAMVALKGVLQRGGVAPEGEVDAVAPTLRDGEAPGGLGPEVDAGVEYPVLPEGTPLAGEGRGVRVLSREQVESLAAAHRIVVKSGRPPPEEG